MQVVSGSLHPSRLKPAAPSLQRKGVAWQSSRALHVSGTLLCLGRSQRQQHQYQRSWSPLCTAANEDLSSADVKELANLISAQPMDDEQRVSYNRLANVLRVPLSTIKGMAYKKKAFAKISPDELRERISTIARVVEVSEEQARQMVVIQPGLCFDTEKQAETLKFGIQTICWELEANKEEVVKLILENQSVLHGRQLHLSVADIANLAMLREPKGRVVE